MSQSKLTVGQYSLLLLDLNHEKPKYFVQAVYSKMSQSKLTVGQYSLLLFLIP